MELLEIANELKECTDAKKAYVLLSMIEDSAEELKKQIKPDLEQEDLGSIIFEKLGRIFSVSEISKSELDVKSIKDELPTEVMAMYYRPTSSDLKAMGRKDLIDKFSTKRKQRLLKVSKIS